MGKLIVGQTDLATVNPKLAAEWNYDKNIGIKPTDVTAGCETEVWWKCSKGHEWPARVKDRNRKKSGCSICSGRRVLIGYNDLATTNPELAAEWNYDKNTNIKPTDVTVGSNKYVWWKCSKGHEWPSRIADRKNGHGCSICSGRRVLIGYNDLATTNPKLAAEWNYEKNGELKPTDVTAGSNKHVWWKCSKDHEWPETVHERNRGVSCPYCSNKRVLIGYNDLATTNPELAAEWNYDKNTNIKPTDVTVGSNKYVWWKCSKGHEWPSRITDRKNGHGCSICNESYLEKLVRKILDNNNMLFQGQYKFSNLTGLRGGLLSYDFAIFSDKMVSTLIECQGKHHYKSLEIFGGEERFTKQQHHDKLKREYAARIGVPLIEIPYIYDTEEKVEKFLRENGVI